MANLTEEEEETSLLNVGLPVFATGGPREVTGELCALVRQLPKGPRRLWDTLALVGLDAMVTTYAPPVTLESRL